MYCKWNVNDPDLIRLNRGCEFKTLKKKKQRQQQPIKNVPEIQLTKQTQFTKKKKEKKNNEM